MGDPDGAVGAAPLPDGGKARRRWLRRGVQLETISIAYNVLEAMVAVTFGVAAGSVALTAFGVDSAIEVASGTLLMWRLHAELVAGRARAATERIAARVAGLLLLGLAAYVLADASRQFLRADRPQESPLGIALGGLSLAVMPFLGRAKVRAAEALGSAALKADAYETLGCAWLSLSMLLGLALHAVLGWWWADPVAALAMLPWIVRKGLEAVRAREED